MTKRTKCSKRIRLALIGGLTAGVLAGCDRDKPPLNPGDIYANNDYVPGVGYYHAPFSNWFRLPYNYYDAGKQRFFYGGEWGPAPFSSIINVSSPSPLAASSAEAARTDIRRGGFGNTGGSFSTYG